MLAENQTIVQSVKELAAGWHELEKLPEDPLISQAVKSYYEDTFLKQLQETLEGEPRVDVFMPRTFGRRLLQYHYILKNPNPTSERWKLQDAGDGSAYSQSHKKFHPQLLSIMQRMKFYDMLLIDPQGAIVYSAAKEVDFGTSLIDGPYADTSLAKAFQLASKRKDQGATVLVDFEKYAPSLNAPAAFMATPLFEAGRLVGVLAMQLSTEQLNLVLSGNKGWQAQGLGETGEVFAFGSDNRYRTDARSIMTNPDAYLAKLAENGINPEILANMRRYKTSVLNQELGDDLSKEALRRNSGTGLAKGHRGTTRLISYQPAGIEGLDWGIVAKVDESEAFAPIDQYEKLILISSIIFVVALTMLATFFAGRWVRPIHSLAAAVEQVGEGRDDVTLAEEGRDELSGLAKSFNGMVGRLRESNLNWQRHNQENEGLLLNILPAPIAKRLKQGETNIVDLVSDVSLLRADIEGFDDIVRQQGAESSLMLLNSLIDTIDEAGERLGVEKVKTMGNNYLAACGLTIPRVDHAYRILRFAKEITEIIQRMNSLNNLQLSYSITLHAGPVVAGIVGRRMYTYDIWGDTVETLDQVHDQAPHGTAIITVAFRAALGEDEATEPGPQLTLGGGEQVSTFIISACTMRP